MQPDKKQRNYIFATFWLSFITMAILLGLWFLPTFSEGGVKTRKINILSDIVSDSLMESFFVSPTSDVEMSNAQRIAISNPNNTPQSKSRKSITVAEVNKSNVSSKSESKTTSGNPIEIQNSYPDKGNVDIDSTTQQTAIKTGPIVITPLEANNDVSIPPIENITEPNFNAFRDKLRNGQKVRIAVAGDSFIEGDIFTQDMRELLQKKYGGGGVGFMPITSQVAGFRQSVEHKFGGWTTKSVVNSRGDYHLSGYTFIPTEGAWVQYKGSNYRQHLQEYTNAKLLFVNKLNTKITVLVNDTIRMTFTPESGEQLQAISIDKRIKTIKFSVTDVAGFTAYGAVLDGQGGVSVDNYSIRSYSGAGLANLSADIAAQSQGIIPYDLIILQYGLNVASDGVTNYSQYAQKLYDVITNLKRVMPNCAILVMSVSDRQNRSGKTMPAIYALERTQRAVANQCGVSFWSTLYAMQNAGGMATFVKKGWAAKDYTHLSAKGGKVVADIFIKSLEP